MCDALEAIKNTHGMDRAVALAADLVAATTLTEDIRHADIEQDNMRHTITESAEGQGAKVAKQKLRTRSLKDLIRSLRTSISITKLCDADRYVREYLLYVLLDACWQASERVNVPGALQKQEHTAEQWVALG